MTMDAVDRTHDEIDAEALFSVIGARLREKQALAPNLTFAFAVIDEGRAFVLDAQAPDGVRPAWQEDADVRVATNRRTLVDYALGRFDPDRPGKEHLFLWTGDPSSWAALGRVFAAGRSVLSTRIEALAGRL